MRAVSFCFILSSLMALSSPLPWILAHLRARTRACLLPLVCCAAALAQEPAGQPIFASNSDIGDPKTAGSSTFDASTGTYVVKGGGENMWGTRDAFHLAWTQLSGDFALTADVTWPAAGTAPHRKASLVIRSSLDPESPYVDAAWHASGLTSMQWRDAQGAETDQICANVSSPLTLRLERRGDEFWMSWAKKGEPLQLAGGSVRIAMPQSVYVGLGVCSHDDRVLETAAFSNIRLERIAPPTGTARLQSTLEIFTLANKQRRAVYTGLEHFEAPNWLRDGRELLINEEGHLYTVPVAGGKPVPVDTGTLSHLNNDHVLSPDGAWLAITARDSADNQPRVYVVPSRGGTPRLITPSAPSYCHGWSPDGLTLAFGGERDGLYGSPNGGAFDVFSVPALGGAERQLTRAAAPEMNDGADYTPNGQWIYFNTTRTGRMQIWRMHPDGSLQQPVTHDEFNNWFPHPSPDGKYIVFVSYSPQVDKAKHPANQEVLLRLLELHTGETRILAKVFGGQGTMNVNSWSPDSQEFAFVSYRMAYDGDAGR